MSKASMQTPKLAKESHLRSFHGETFNDLYYWVKNDKDPRVRAHLEAENAYFAAQTADLEPITEAVFQGIKSYTCDSDVEIPTRIGDYWYLRRYQAGEDYPIYTRLKAESWQTPKVIEGELAAGEQVVINVPELAQGQEFCRIGYYLPSPDNRLVAYLVDFDGGERMDLHIRDIQSGQMVDNAIHEAGYDLAFSTDSRYVFYSRTDASWRCCEIWRHQIGTDATDDVLIYREDDERFTLSAYESAGRTHLVIDSASRTSGECYLLDLADPNATVRSVAARMPGVEYHVEVADDHLLIVHNRDAQDFSIATAPIDASDSGRWEKLIDAEAGGKIEEITFNQRALIVSARENGLPIVKLIPRRQGQYLVAQQFNLSGGGELDCVRDSGNTHWQAPKIRFAVSSLTRPESVFEYDLDSETKCLLQTKPVPGFDPDKYREHRLWARAEDGTEIPISLIAPADMRPDGTNAGIIYGYGAYEISVDPTFLAAILPLVDRGNFFAIAHVRGGGEMGRAWYLHGKLLEKRNSFTDFVDCAKYLQESGWVAPDRLAAYGGSAGGLLMGAVANLAPERFQAIHAAVPFVDALTTILDPTMPLTAEEWEEWGNPIESAEVYAYMKSYTPYENIAAKPYPAILATTSLNDVRVSYAEPVKWVAQLRDTVLNDPQQRPILLKCEMVAGHGGKSGRYSSMRQRAEEFAFLLKHIDG